LKREKKNFEKNLKKRGLKRKGEKNNIISEQQQPLKTHTHTRGEKT
jgi:hypothetical protein